MKNNSQQTFNISSTSINIVISTSDHGLTHIARGPRAGANGWIGIQIALVKCQFIFNWSRKHKIF